MSIIKTALPTKGVEITPFHKAIFQAAETHRKAGDSMADKMRALLTSKYGSTMPNLKQYSEDQEALKALAKAKGLADNQHVRKPFAAAVIEQYGALPVSMAEAAVTKRAQRLAELEPQARLAYNNALELGRQLGLPDMECEAIAQHAIKSAKKSTAPVGAQPGQTQDNKPNPAETLEQLIARVGLVNVLEACQQILATERATQTKAKTIGVIASDLRQASSRKAA